MLRSVAAATQKTLAWPACVRAFSTSQTSESLAEFRDQVKQFAQAVIAPHAEHVDKSNDFPTNVNLWREMGEFGLLGEAQCQCAGHLTYMHARHTAAVPIPL
jgi:isovaleryl-CoA dehydrogenase